MRESANWRDQGASNLAKRQGSETIFIYFFEEARNTISRGQDTRLVNRSKPKISKFWVLLPLKIIGWLFRFLYIAIDGY